MQPARFSAVQRTLIRARFSAVPAEPAHEGGTRSVPTCAELPVAQRCAEVGRYGPLRHTIGTLRSPLGSPSSPPFHRRKVSSREPRESSKKNRGRARSVLGPSSRRRLLVVRRLASGERECCADGLEINRRYLLALRTKQRFRGVRSQVSVSPALNDARRPNNPLPASTAILHAWIL